MDTIPNPELLALNHSQFLSGLRTRAGHPIEIACQGLVYVGLKTLDPVFEAGKPPTQEVTVYGCKSCHQIMSVAGFVLLNSYPGIREAVA